MNCLDFRRQLAAVPEGLDADALAHGADCTRCAQARNEALAFESKLRDVLAVPVPESLADRILLRQTTEARRARGARRRVLAWRIAAVLVLAVAGQVQHAPRAGAHRGGDDQHTGGSPPRGCRPPRPAEAGLRGTAAPTRSSTRSGSSRAPASSSPRGTSGEPAPPSPPSRAASRAPPRTKRRAPASVGGAPHRGGARAGRGTPETHKPAPTDPGRNIQARRPRRWN